MKIASSLRSTIIKPIQASLDSFVQGLHSTYQELATAFNGNISYGDGTNADNINGSWINVTAPVTPNTNFTVNHNLNRIPVGFHVVQKDRACDVFMGSVAPTKTQYTLQASVASAVLRLFFFSLILCIFSTRSAAQGAYHQNTAQKQTTPTGSSGISGAILQPIPSALITVCNGTTIPASGVTCTGLATLFSNVTLTNTIANPFNADLGGNYTFYATAGQNYVISVSGTGLITYSYVWTAPVTTGGSSSFSSLTVTGALNANGGGQLLGAFVCSNFETTRCIDVNNTAGWSGADVCAWTLSAYANLPSTGGKIIVSDGVYPPCSGGLAIAVSGSKYVDIYFGNVSLTLSNSLSLSGGGGNSHLSGIPDITLIKQSATFPAATPTIQLGGSGETNLTATGLTAVCNASVTNSIGFKAQTQDMSGVRYGIAQNCTQYSFWFEGFGLSSCDYCWALTKGATANGFYIHNSIAFKGYYLHSVANAGPSDPVANHIVIDGSSAVINNVHCEDGTNCIDVGPVSSSIAETHGVSGGTGITTVIKVENISSNRLESYDTLANGATNTIVDSLNSITRTDTLMARYQTFGPTGNQIWMEDGTSGRVFYHAGANQNLRLESQLSFITLEAINDALAADVPLELGATAVVAANTGSEDLGTTALPWTNLWLGTAATNNFKFAPAAIAAARTVQINDPGATSALLLGPTNLFISPIAPTIAAGGCGGTVAAIQNANGTASFEIFTGTAPTSAGCTVTFPVAAHHWICPTITHTSAVSTTNFIILQTGALSSTSVTFQLFSDVAAATAPAASDTWAVSGCHAN